MDWRSSWPKLLTWHICTQVQLRLGLTMDLLDTRQAGQPGPSYTWPLIFFSVEIFAVRGSIRLNRFCVCNDGSFISFETKCVLKEGNWWVSLISMVRLELAFCKKSYELKRNVKRIVNFFVGDTSYWRWNKWPRKNLNYFSSSPANHWEKFSNKLFCKTAST